MRNPGLCLHYLEDQGQLAVFTAANVVDKLMLVVVLPTPPFWFTIARILLKAYLVTYIYIYKLIL
ncbi:hypothetical protein BIY23_02945 [Wolbachia pipientis]|uniref:Uncharacterized protein n=1 Tax=Wolbachia pipientis TaxID=955 RepID=A0A1E7QJJ5_WOLPI|nr:hypothetical protein BIY23_02945 [Wolbachia pipientis]